MTLGQFRLAAVIVTLVALAAFVAFAQAGLRRARFRGGQVQQTTWISLAATAFVVTCLAALTFVGLGFR